MPTLLFAVAAIAIAFLLPVKYEASVTLVSVGDDGGGRLAGAGALLSQFGGLAALGGFGVNGGGRKAESMATLQSAALIEAFIGDRELLPILFAHKWDSGAKRWMTTDPKDTPTLWKAERMFRTKIRFINEDKKEGLIRLTIRWNDAQQAADWANDLVARANARLRERAIESSKKNLDYLNEQIRKTTVVELQQAIYGLIEAEIKKVMVAQGSSEYAFRIVDPARVPEVRSSPNRLLIAACGVLFGFALGSALALVWRKDE